MSANAKEEWYERFRRSSVVGVAGDGEHFSSFFTLDRYRASRSVALASVSNCFARLV